ncbi:hypothetical protein C1M56_06555 [Vibrio diazotrophicus]|jgi:hypothetical protein|nr:hypothetical protein C1M56_06555 [Vibrio diazotrophicus]
MLSKGKYFPQVLLDHNSVKQRLLSLRDGEVNFSTQPFQMSVKSLWCDSTSARSFSRSLLADEFELDCAL